MNPAATPDPDEALVVAVQLRVPAAAWRDHRTGDAVLAPATDFAVWTATASPRPSTRTRPPGALGSPSPSCTSPDPRRGTRPGGPHRTEENHMFLLPRSLARLAATGAVAAVVALAGAVPAAAADLPEGWACGDRLIWPSTGQTATVDRSGMVVMDSGPAKNRWGTATTIEDALADGAKKIGGC